MASWDSIPDAQKPFQRRLMEVFAGFVEHTDAQVGRLIDGLEQRGLRDNTIIFYILATTAPARKAGTIISELLAQNMIPNTIEQQLAALDKIGGIAALGTNKTESMYHAGWAWAGDTPFRYTKLVASHFGGTRNPLVVSWPKGISNNAGAVDHVNDVAPTLYEILGIIPPQGGERPRADPSTASAWPIRSPIPRRLSAKPSSISTTMAAARSITMAGSPRPLVRLFLVARRVRAHDLGFRQGRLGTL